MEDWDYTYEHLDSETRSLFTRDEWFQKNRWFADNGQVIYHIESVRRLGTGSGPVVEVKLGLTYEDGSSSTRDTYFVYEDGEWKHAFGLSFPLEPRGWLLTVRKVLLVSCAAAIILACGSLSENSGLEPIFGSGWWATLTLFTLS